MSTASSMTVFPSFGRLLGVDLGTVRIGLAICDPDRILASPFETYTRRTLELDTAYFQRLVREQHLVGCVVGLPISLNDTEGPKATESRAFAAWLTSITQLPVELVDERFTSAAADEVLIAHGVKRNKRQGQRDRIAAVFILQAFLDSQPRR
jgi:putative Holliday junction resolvase